MNRLGMARSAFVASAVVAAFALAACSGGGDSDTRADRADAAVADLNQKIAALEADKTRLTDERDTANGTVEMLTTQIGDPDDPAEGSLHAMLNAALADAEGLRTQIGTLTTMRDQLATDLGIADADVISLTAQIGDPANPADGSLHAMLNAANARADGLAAHIGTADDDASDADTATLYAQLKHYKAKAEDLQAMIDEQGDVADVLKAKAVNTALRRDGTGAPRVSAIEASTADGLTAKSTGYEDAGEAPDVAGLPSGWRGKMLTKDGSMLAVYSNIEDAEGTPLDNLYDSSKSSGKARAYDVHRTDGSSDTPQNDVNEVVDDGSIAWKDVVRDDNTLSGTADEDAETFTFTFEGSVFGVAGTFSCVGEGRDDCTPPTYTDGKLPVGGMTTGVWSFSADDPNALAAVADDDYVSLGWWLGDNEDTTYSYVAFANGHGSSENLYGADDDGDVPNTVSGEASYTGGAAGKYSLLDEIEDTAHGGHWTATAKLTANFDAELDEEADPATTAEGAVKVSGSISAFMVDGESQPGWKVTLKAFDNAADTKGQQNPGTFDTEVTLGVPTQSRVATWSRGGAVSGEGTWTAKFRGDEGTVADTPAQPVAVTGNFNADVGNRAYIEGAFAAQKDEDD